MLQHNKNFAHGRGGLTLSKSALDVSFYIAFHQSFIHSLPKQLQNRKYAGVNL
ncbi:MAG: hypothetical protein IT276_14660 [Ignavibacteriaceae bacterium]|nr:hypothetical protein [Ignavibacteriaceae bacterium]HRN27675.1 hypothetical protein [Ignavibacteriaceae bacterium]HRP94065.1 hypothetical protein [Ignavibacteriaceae bacterium]HRQ55369.1 hypothetical protein [Ignavibacteriaceae bacterium]